MLGKLGLCPQPSPDFVEDTPLVKTETHQFSHKKLSVDKTHGSGIKKIDQSGCTHSSQGIVHRRHKQREHRSKPIPDKTVTVKHRIGDGPIGRDKIRVGRCVGIVNSHSEKNQDDGRDNPANGTVSRESDPEETGRAARLIPEAKVFPTQS